MPSDTSLASAAFRPAGDTSTSNLGYSAVEAGIQHEVHAAVHLPLVLGLRELEPADLLEACHVAAAVGLGVEAHDVHEAELGEVVRETGLELEELRPGEGVGGGHEGHPNGQVPRHERVRPPEALLQHRAVELLEREVHARLVGRELVPGHAHVVVVEHHAGEHVRGGVVAHQEVAARPVERAVHRGARAEPGPVDPVQDAVRGVHRLHDAERLAPGDGQRPLVAEHAAPGGEERRPIEVDAVGRCPGDARVELAEVAVALVEAFDHAEARGKYILTAVPVPGADSTST